MKSVVVPVLLMLGCISGGAQAYGYGVDSSSHNDGSNTLCPTATDSISQACLDAILPPFPICREKTASEWVAHAIDVYPRCCEGDLSSCKCPVKDSDTFKAKIVGYCKAVDEECQATKSLTQASGVGNLRGGFDMEQQIQREEYTP